MTDERKALVFDEAIIQTIRTMDESEPPEGFTARVMADLQPKKPTIWRRFILWLTEPRALTYRPLQVIPAITCVVALLALAFVTMNGPNIENVPHLSTVRFVLNDKGIQAKNVAVIGSFNEWRADRSEMWYDSNERAWILEAQLPPGDHEYLFLVNGKKLVPDPMAHISRDDGFGNKNSIVFVNEKYEQTL